ncbi:type II toxin-antitoxin system PemK/MazF family toxin [Deinococcus sp. HMF7604]|uniref:type II toxin-antitoxin system PemK/MazF family toxin n=1 Tax=Deinococcus betulae TaxID=2873312 RepID=UPI001CCC5F05|nr:type II toxin-antitoxin system PemK/MazF family toxin [Deinococcus betulae]MBZ9750715.1 type II toxin-antitoxin system PemK/MazF family toxin [Deinococcus betulae]
MTGPDLDAWNAEKKRLSEREGLPLFRAGEVWWCSLGVGVGVEITGKGAQFRRPVIVLRKLGPAGCIVAPLTTRPREGDWFHPLNWGQGPRWVMLNQMRFVSATRLSNRMVTLSAAQVNAVRASLRAFWQF